MRGRPARPRSPQYKTGLFAAFLIGCLLGMAGAIAAEKLDRVFRSASQVEKATGVAVLGMVPLVRNAIGQRASIVEPDARQDDVVGGRGDARGIHRHQPQQPRPAGAGHRRHLVDAGRRQDDLRRGAGRLADQDERLAARAPGRPRSPPGQARRGARSQRPRRHDRRVPDGHQDARSVHPAPGDVGRRLHLCQPEHARTRRKFSNRTP